MNLREQMKAALSKFKSLADKVNGESRDYTEDELNEKESLIKDIERLKLAIEDESRALEIENFLSQPAVEPVENPLSDIRGEVKQEKVVSSVNVVRDEKDDNDNKYRSQFRSAGDFYLAIKRVTSEGRIDPRLADEQRAAGMSSGIGSDGGFLLPQTIAEGLLKKTFETGILASKCRSYALPRGETYTMKLLKDSSRADGYRAGGLTVHFLGESEAMTASQISSEVLDFKLKKMAGFCYVTEEQLSNEDTLSQEMNSLFPQEFGFVLDSRIMSGAGAKDPVGFMNSACKVTVAKESGQTAETIVFNNLVKMMSRMWSRSLSNAVWFYNQDCFPQLMNLSFPNSNVPIWLPNNSIVGSPFNTLLGIPAIPVEQCETLGTEGDIILADMSQYQLITRGGINSASSIHVRFNTNETAFRFVLRIDGKPLWISPLTPAKGSNTISPFVTLATRA
ncbi:MAG: phage major capsid protein [Thermoproteota archaeon]|nr:MAG: phage major capsid protein [Candidatus Korarchaeota archaeon]